MSQTGITVDKDGKKRMTVVPITPFTTTQDGKKRIVVTPITPVATTKDGKKRITPTPLEPLEESSKADEAAPMCPSGCVTEQACQKRIADALKGHDAFPVGKGQEKYQEFIDRMEKAYSNLEPVGEDEDILFDAKGFRKKKSTSKKKSANGNKVNKTGCGKY